MRRALLSFVFILAGSAAGYAQADQDVKIKNQIDSILIEQTAQDLPGAAVSVIKNGEVFFEGAYGMADLSYDVPILTETVFNIGSVSKQFTVFAILMLEKEGKLSLQDDVRKFIPELYDFGSEITLEHLARHTSGLKTVNFLARLVGWRQTDLSTHEQMMELIFRQRTLDFIPGTEYKYSNTGTMLLAEVVARVTGVPFSEYMRKQVFDPLNMTSTFIRDDHAAVIKNEAHGYYWEDGHLKKAINPISVIGYTNVYTTVNDLFKWVQNFSTPVVGDQAIFDKMESQTVLQDGRMVEHAMGQFITPYKGLRQVQHTGGHRAFVAYLGRFPELELSIIICSNVEGFDLFGIAYQIVDVFLEGEPVREEVAEETLSLYITLPEQEMNAFKGMYWHAGAQISRRIYIKNDTLVYWRGENNESYFKPISKNEFQQLGPSNKTTVLFDGDNMIFVEPSGLRSVFQKYEPVAYNIEELGRFAGLYFSEELNQTYVFQVEGGMLKVNHPKMKSVTFTPLYANYFISDQWFFNQAEFVRDPVGNVHGFHAGNVQVTKVWFEKLR